MCAATGDKGERSKRACQAQQRPSEILLGKYKQQQRSWDSGVTTLQSYSCYTTYPEAQHPCACSLVASYTSVPSFHRSCSAVLDSLETRKLQVQCDTIQSSIHSQPTNRLIWSSSMCDQHVRIRLLNQRFRGRVFYELDCLLS